LLARANAAPGLPAPGPISSSGSAPLLSGDDGEFVPDFRDMPLETILDDLAQRFDCDWSYAGGAITINRLVTRVFEIRADPSVKQITSEVSGATPSPAQSGSAGGSGGGGGSSGKWRKRRERRRRRQLEPANQHQDRARRLEGNRQHVGSARSRSRAFRHSARRRRGHGGGPAGDDAAGRVLFRGAEQVAGGPDRGRDHGDLHQRRPQRRFSACR